MSKNEAVTFKERLLVFAKYELGSLICRKTQNNLGGIVVDYGVVRPVQWYATKTPFSEIEDQFAHVEGNDALPKIKNPFPSALREAVVVDAPAYDVLNRVKKPESIPAIAYAVGNVVVAGVLPMVTFFGEDDERVGVGLRYDPHDDFSMAFGVATKTGLTGRVAFEPVAGTTIVGERVPIQSMALQYPRTVLL